jgi:hypothetical protein
MKSTMMAHVSSSDGSRTSASPSLPRDCDIREWRRRDEVGFNEKIKTGRLIREVADL